MIFSEIKLFLISEAKYKVKNGKGLQVLALKQMFQRLSIPLAQVKAANTSKNLLNKIRKIISYLYWAKQITKNVYNKVTKNSIGSDPHKLLLNLTDKTNVKKSDKYLAFSSLSIYYI